MTSETASFDKKPRMVNVRSDDGFIFHLKADALRVSRVLRTVDSLSGDEPVLISGLSHDILERCLWWMTNHVDDSQVENEDAIDDINAWERCFFNTSVDNILKLISAANYLDIRRMLILGIKKLAQIMEDKLFEDNPIQAIREAFKMSAPEQTPEEFKKVEQFVRLFVFARKCGPTPGVGKPSAIDPLPVEVTYLPERKLVPPKPRSVFKHIENS
jgi:hypothetical protein